MDAVIIRNLRFELPVGLDAWLRRGKPQPVFLSLEIGSEAAIRNAAATDDVAKALDYGKLYKLVHGKLTTSNAHYRDVQAVHDAVRNCIASNVCVKSEIHLPKAILRAEGGLKYIRYEEWKDDYLQTVETLAISGVRCACIVGVNPHERLEKQTVHIDLLIAGPIINPNHETNGTPVVKLPFDRYQAITAAIVQRVDGSAYQTVEALATAIAQTVTMDFNVHQVTVKVEKPSAIAGIDAAGVQLTRSALFFQNNKFWTEKPGS